MPIGGNEWVIVGDPDPHPGPDPDPSEGPNLTITLRLIPFVTNIVSSSLSS